MKKLSGILLLTSLLLFSACNTFFKINIVVDNPSNDVLVLILDGKDYELLSNSFLELDLVKGEHHFIATVAGKEIFNETVSITNEGLLNLTKSTYVVHKELYLLNQDEYETHAVKALDRQDHLIANKTYEDVHFVVYEGQVFIPKNWDFGIDKELPEEIKTSVGEYEVISKLYRLSSLEKTWGFFGDFDFTQTSDKELKQFLDSLAQDLALEAIE
jgi:hypothetical protein